MRAAYYSARGRRADWSGLAREGRKLERAKPPGLKSVVWVTFSHWREQNDAPWRHTL